jgi:hypothetical protein
MGLALVSGAFQPSVFAQGNAQGDWGDFACQEFHTWPELPEAEVDFGEYLGKDVAELQAVLSPADTTLHQELIITVTGAYPSYGVICNVEFTVGQIGGPEVELGTPVIDPVLGLTCDSVTSSDAQCEELTVQLTAPEDGECFAPGSEHDTRLVFHVEQPALEGAQMRFTVSIPAFECDPEDPEEPGDPEEPEEPEEPVFTSEVDETQDGQTQEESPIAEVRALPSTGSGGLLASDGARQVSGLAFVAAGIALVSMAVRARRRHT